VSLQHVLSGSTHEELLMAAAMFLQKEGFVVEMPGAWETREEFCARVRVSVSHFKRRMERRKFAPQVDLETGPSGRLIRLRSNAAFDDWMRRSGATISR
jgi:hypothetical protein